MGTAVALSNGIVLTGAPGTDSSAGRVHVWARDTGGTGGWSQRDAFDVAAPGELGVAVALAGDTALAAAPAQDLPSASAAGAVWVLRPRGTRWLPSGRLTAARAEPLERYGSAVALSAGRGVVGAALDDGAGLDAGSAWFFRLAPLPSAKLAAGDAGADDRFGASVAAWGDTTVVGAPLDNTVAGADAGSAYVFTRADSGWQLEAKLRADDTVRREEFGSAVAIDARTIAVGAPLAKALGAQDAGAAYVFAHTGADWVREARLVASDAAWGDHLGASIAAEGDTVLVGAPFDDDAGNASGAAYVFVRAGATWVQQAKLVASDASAFDAFGAAVALDGDTALVGAPFGDGPGNASGAVYAFVRAGATWRQEARLVAPDSSADDRLGSAVALRGDTAVAGAPFDDTRGLDAGAVHVFVRSGTTWTRAAKLVADDAGAGDQLGGAVALSGDRLVAGAPFADGAGFSSGAAYVFAASGAGWSQEAKLTAEDAGPSDQLGRAVAVLETAAVVGAPFRDEPYAASGAAYVFTLLESLGPSFCDAADGSLAACPCGNRGGPEGGCDIAQTTGGVRLEVLAQHDRPQNRATLVGTGYVPTAMPAAVVIRSGSLEAQPVVFGDGVRCVGTPLVRLGGTFAVGGTSRHAFGHSAPGGSYYYQLWFRSQPASFCTPDAFNLSNGRVLAW
jgi:FG-GAP repeat